MGTDWRDSLLAGGAPVEVASSPGRAPTWPGYQPLPAVSVHRLAGAVAAVWDFTVHGGSFGEGDAGRFAAAAALAVAERVPLVSLIRSGGTRLQEGMPALVGIPRARLALRAVAAAGLPHLAVADAPTTGGVWISIGSTADLRAAVTGATVGFAGPRVVEAVTGALPGPDSHTAEAARAAGLVDALLAPGDVAGWLAGVLAALTAGPEALQASSGVAVPGRSGAEQVAAARARTLDGADLLERLTDRVPLAAPHGDRSVAAALGRLAGRPVVAVATAAHRGGRPTPDGYRLLRRAALLADRIDLPLLTLVDTPGAEPGPAAERDGVAAAIGEALDAVLACRSPVLAFVHGEGGSGGALAAAAGDRVLMGADSYFAAIGPEGAAAALRLPADRCAGLLRLTPRDVLADRVADAMADWADLPRHLDDLAALDPAERVARRVQRWSGPAGG